MTPLIHLHKSKEYTVHNNHPWVFPKAIQKIEEKPSIGDLVKVLDSNLKVLGIGVYNPESLYRVRILLFSWENTDIHSLKEIVDFRLKQALLVRKSLNLPNDKTNAYRLFNSEADGLSGLTIDCFNNYLVVSSSAFWVEKHRELIEKSLSEMMPDKHIIWQPQVKMLVKDGLTTGINATDNHFKTMIKEGGVAYEVSFDASQKTGLFLDQRENHERIASFVEGKKVLDLYTYCGGFALHAARAGARFVTAVDSSEAAIMQARHNAQLNQLEHIEFVCDDARNWLSRAGDYDVVILDPPKLVPGRAHLNKAKNYYRFLHRETIKVMKQGSILITCNCSSALSANEFVQLVEAQAKEVSKSSRIIGVYGAASCHTTKACFPEGHYLTTLIMAIL